MNTKTPKCKYCGGPHYKTFCFNAPKKPMKASSKPLKQNRPMYTKKAQKPLKRAYIRSKTTNERKILITKLDRVFSVYIRRKDAIGNVAKCVTCGNRNDWQNQQNGHFLSRRKLHTRWDEENCHVQCNNCNVTLRGNLGRYEEYLKIKYGNDIVERLNRKANSNTKIQTYELEKKLAYYQKKLKDLLENI